MIYLYTGDLFQCYKMYHLEPFQSLKGYLDSICDLLHSKGQSIPQQYMLPNQASFKNQYRIFIIEIEACCILLSKIQSPCLKSWRSSSLLPWQPLS